MNFKRIYFILIPALLALMNSCLGSSEVEVSGNPYFVSLSFLANDSIPNIDKAVFTLEYDESLQDSIIVNLDSLPFETRIDSVYPVFYFRSTSITRLFQDTPDGIDTIYLSGNSSNLINDTIDFTYPTRVQNFSADGTAERTYHIKVNVHQVEPELYVWNKLKNQITANSDINQQAILFNNRYLFYTGSEIGNSLYVAEGPDLTTESQWISKTLSFPATNRTSLKLRYMTVHQDKLFVSDNDNRLYSSTDGETWTEVAYDMSEAGIYNILFSLNDSLWTIARTTATNEFQLRYLTHDNKLIYQDKLPQKDSRRFPVNDYASLVFKSAVGRPKFIVIGGYSETGELISSNWIGQINIQNQMAWEPLRNNALPPVQDAALVQYDDKLLFFGGLQNNGTIVSLRESLNEGLDWSIPDSTYNMLPEEFETRSYQSVIINEVDQRLYFIGGKNNNTIYSDVWTAKLNRLKF